MANVAALLEAVRPDHVDEPAGLYHRLLQVKLLSRVDIASILSGLACSLTHQKVSKQLIYLLLLLHLQY